MFFAIKKDFIIEETKIFLGNINNYRITVVLLIHMEILYGNHDTSAQCRRIFNLVKKELKLPIFYDIGFASTVLSGI